MVMKAYLEAGQFVTTHGVVGELKLYPWADGPEFIAQLPRLYPAPQGGAPLEIERVRAHKGMCIIKLRGVDDMDAARAQVGRVYYLAKADARLPKGRFFIDDLLDCEVVDAETGRVYGRLTNVDRPAAQDIYTVTDTAGGEHMLPAVPEFVKNIDIEARKILVTPIEGMFTEAVNGDED